MAYGTTVNNKESVPQNVWDEKDKKIIRQNCIGNAVRFLKSKPGYDKAEDVFELAAKFEEWIHR